MNGNGNIFVIIDSGRRASDIEASVMKTSGDRNNGGIEIIMIWRKQAKNGHQQ
jgi:diaminopimelate epimerase